MQIKPFNELAADVAADAQIAVYVLLSQENDDVEFIAIKPRAQAFISGAEFTARQLRPVAVIGLNGLKPLCAFKEPLDPQLISKIGQAFCEYTRVLLGDRFVEHVAREEERELGRMFALPDPRPYPPYRHPRFQA
jgi:hypothetical protein